MTEMRILTVRQPWAWAIIHGGEAIGTAACSPWAQGEAHHLVLANPRALSEHIPYRGALGLRRLDDDMAARVMEAVV